MKLFSLEEANALIPTVRRLFAQIDRNRARMRRNAPEVKRAVERAAFNGGIPRGHHYAEAIMDFMASVETLLRLGVEIKDFERGLCDFPHWRDGRVVYLCWKRDEERIEYWHDTDAGFAGRQPI
jgi:hypothetical protein